MQPLRLIEGNITVRPLEPLGNFVTDSIQPAAEDVHFDFGGLRKDIHVECDQPVTIKFNLSSNPGMTVNSGVWDWTEEFADGAYVTFTVPTNFRMGANG